MASVGMSFAEEVATDDLHCRPCPKSLAELQKRRTREVEEAAQQPDVKPGSVVFRRRRAQQGAFIFHPYEPRMQQWSSVMAIVLVIEFFVLPLQLAFSPNPSFFDRPLLVVWRSFADLALWADIVVQFGVQVERFDTGWAKEFPQIALWYIQGAFVVDVVSVLPVVPLFGLQDISILALGDGYGKDMCYGALFAYHRLLRFARIGRVIRTLESLEHVFACPTHLTHSETTLLKSCAAVLFAIHNMGCVWSTMAICGLPDFNWYTYYAAVKSDDAKLYTVGGAWSIYMCAFYWAIYTLTGIGFGDIVPVTPLEYVVASICMGCAALTWAWVIANVVSIFALLGEAKTTHLKTLDSVNEITRSSNFRAKRLAQRLREYFTKLRNVRSDGCVFSLIDRLSPELTMEVVLAVHGDWLGKVWWMRMVPRESDEFMVELTRRLVSHLHAPNELIPSKIQLSIVRQGVCLYGGRLLFKGDVYGEDMLLSSGALRKDWATLTLTYLHLIVLTKKTFEEVLARHFDVQPYIRKAYRIFVVIRGVHKLAEDIKRERRLAGDTIRRGFTLVNMELRRDGAVRSFVCDGGDEHDSADRACATASGGVAPAWYRGTAGDGSTDVLRRAGRKLLHRIDAASENLTQRALRLEADVARLAEQVRRLAALR